MDYMIVSLKADEMEMDLQVPSFIPIAELLSMFNAVLPIEVSSGHRLQAEPLGRILDNHKTLEQEQVAHGAILTLIR